MNKYGITIPAEITDKRERKKWYQKYYQHAYSKTRRTPKTQWVVKIPEEITDTKERMRFYKREFAKIWRKKNPQRARANKRKCYLKMRDKNIAYARQYQQDNPNWRSKLDKAKTAERKHIYRAKKHGSHVNRKGVAAFIKAARSRKLIPCYYCKKPTPGSQIHIDHIVAISNNGNHSLENICVSCPSCNLTKQAKTISEWKTQGQQLFEL